VLTEVAEGVHVHRSAVLRNNTVVVRGPAGALVVDPGITGAELRCLSSDLRVLGEPVVAGFATHPDWDHVLWHGDLGEAPRYATAGSAAFMAGVLAHPEWRQQTVEGLPPEVADDVPLDGFGRLTGLPPGTEEIPWDGPRVRIVEHPAHAPGHAALLIEDRGVLVAGDMLSDLFPPMLDDGDVLEAIDGYASGLLVLEAVVDDFPVGVVVPGHGSVGDAGELRRRLELDRSYLQALREGTTPHDPRLGAEAEPGWEWVAAIHEGQAQRVAARE
jgi:glyoxylase-like metal-dependent hydrolase (beta-lactamase superfamily II)